jgi:membrane protease YdiL (CAAX protease family)
MAVPGPSGCPNRTWTSPSALRTIGWPRATRPGAYDARDVSLSQADQPTLAIEQLRLPTLLALFLVPGAFMTVVFVVIAPFIETAGFPPIAAVLVAILIVLLPIELGVILRAGRGHPQRIRSVVPYRRPLPIRDWLWLVPLLVVAAFVGFGLSMAIEPAVIDRLFGWLPDWFVRPIDPDRVGDYSREAWLATLAVYLVLNGFAGPIVEELYFRGYLLPRMEWMGRWAPLVNVSLFSLYHFWSPWQILGRILGFGPTVYAVRWKENVYLGMVVHCTLNTLTVIIVASLVLGRL